MKKIALFAVGAGVAVIGFAAQAAESDDAAIGIATISAAVPTSKPVVLLPSATEVDGNDLAVDELHRIAMNEEESLRIAAVQVLGEMKSVRARAILGVILHANGFPTVRAAAADELGDLGDGESMLALAMALDVERNEEVRDVISANLERNLTLEALPEATPEPAKPVEVAAMAYAG